MEEIKLNRNKFFWLWVLFFLVLILGSPLLEGGETYHTIIVLRLWVLGFGLYYFQRRLRGEQMEILVPLGSWLLLLLWLVLSLSLVVTHYYYITVYWYSNLLIYLLFFFLSLNLLGEERGGKRLLVALFFTFISAGVMESVLGLRDYFHEHSVRASGSFFNPAYYSGYLVGLVSFPLSGMVFDLLPELARRRKVWLWVGLCFSLVLILGGLLVSASRAVIFALVPIGLILLFRFRLKAVLALGILILAVAIIPNPLRTRLKNLGEDPYAWDRLTIWKSSLRMIRHHPFGVGLGMYQYYYDRYEYPVRTEKIGRYSKYAHQAHNEFLNFWAECSGLALVLGLAWLVLMLLPMVKLLIKKREEYLNKNPALLFGFGGSLLGILSHSLVDSNLHQPPIMILALIDLAGIIYLSSDFKPSLVKKICYQLKHPVFLRIFILIAGILIGLIMSYQALIFGFSFESRRIAEPEARLKALVKLARLPSGYAPLYYQIAMGFRKLFLETQNPNFGLQAVSYFEFASRLNPENYEYFYRWAQTVYEFARYFGTPALFKRSEQLAKLSLKRSPHHPLTYLLLAQIAHLEEDFPKEEKWLRTVLEIEPYYFQARLLLIELLIRDGRLEEAKKELALLKAHKREVDQIPKEKLNSIQEILIQITDTEIQSVEFRLGTQNLQIPNP